MASKGFDKCGWLLKVKTKFAGAWSLEHKANDLSISVIREAIPFQTESISMSPIKDQDFLKLKTFCSCERPSMRLTCPNKGSICPNKC